MEIPEKKHQQSTFDGGIDSDTAAEYFPANKARYMLNCRAFSYGEVGVITNIAGNTLITTPLPTGSNKTIGSIPDEENNRFFFFVYNSAGNHSIFLYNSISNQVISVFQSQLQSNGVDILRFNPANLILHIDIVDGNLIYWVDGLNKARKFNISKMMDNTSSGYGHTIYEDYITAFKATSIRAPQCAYITDTTRNANNLYANLFKFCQRFHYDDGEMSDWSDWSKVPLPPNQSYLGIANITYSNNAIALQLETGSKLVTKIEIAIKINNNQINAVNEIQTTDFVICQLLVKAELNIPDLSLYTWNFYNDGSYSTTDQLKVFRLNSLLPRVPLCQSFVKNAITYTNFEEGYDSVLVNASVACTFQDLFIPGGTLNKLNNPLFTVTFVSAVKQRQFDFITAETRYNPTFNFTVGPDVKKGNVYTIYGRNGGTNRSLSNGTPFGHGTGDADNYFFSYTANANDTAQTVAAQLKQSLRGIGRGYPKNINGGISAETTTSGSVSWNYSYIGKLGQDQTNFTGNVTPVSYSTLQDDGTSFNIIKYGSVRNYAFVYCDDDGRQSNAYTSPTCVIRTPFITEVGLTAGGDFQRPVHTITINHQPPLWAKYWKLVRTPDSGNYIWILIQQVITYNGENGDGSYLDLVVGSLPTYNLLHPNSILKYDFARGDRLRPVLDTASGNLYGQYFDTEILSYNPETTQTINSNIVINGTNTVTPVATVLPSQAGFYIQIAGNERLIVTVNVGPNTYTLDAPIVGVSTSSPTTAVTFPNYTLVDRRGTIRIAMPTGITINPNSIVELYTPQPNAVSTDYKIFNDFGQKFEIINWGTPNAYHSCNVQDQTASLPGLLSVINGDAYIRNREYPTNIIFPGTQVTVNKAVDANFSDFYFSDMHDLGKVYPQDLGLGRKHFGQRVRFSNNYIQDTTINGLNDFDATSYVDYNDPYGEIKLTKFRENNIYTFKPLKDGWIPVNNVLSTDGSGNTLLVGNAVLLNPMQYFSFDGGVGNNPESVVSNSEYIYHACPAQGVFVRIAMGHTYGKSYSDNIEQISVKYFFDKAARQMLSTVQQYNLQLLGGVDREFSEIIWSMPQHIQYLFNGGFDSNWTTFNNIQPNGSTGVVVTQPANGNVVWNGTTGNFEITMNSNFVGTDTFSYKLQLPDTSFTAVKNECLTVIEAANRPKGYRARVSTVYCEQIATPLPPPAGQHFTLYANYGMTIQSVFNNTTTGVPASFNNIALPPGGSAAAVYTTIGAGIISVKLLGTPVLPGHQRLVLYVNSIAVDQQDIIYGKAIYGLTIPTTNDPTTIQITIATF